MPSFNSAWGPWHWENAVFKYTNGTPQLGFSTRENNLLWLSVGKVKQRRCPASYTKSTQTLVVSQKLEFPSEWKYTCQADEHRKPFRQTQHRWLPDTFETCSVCFFYVNPLVATASFTHINGAMCLLEMGSPDIFVHLCDFWMIGTSYLTCSNSHLSVFVQ